MEKCRRSRADSYLLGGVLSGWWRTGKHGCQRFGIAPELVEMFAVGAATVAAFGLRNGVTR